MDTRVLSARTVWLCLCLSAAVSAAAASRHLAANSSMQRAYPANCTPPRTEQDAKKPFCFVPVTASPQAQAFLAQAAAGSNGFGAYLVSDPLHNKASLNNIRQGFESSSAPGSRGAEKAFLQSTRNDTIAGVPVVFGTPKGVASSSSSNPVDAKLIIYLHGGGYSSGSCYYQWSTGAPTAAAAGLPVLCVEYRLAPEHPFPAGLNDALAVYKTLLQQGYKGSNLVLLGDSAGGGMVAAVAIQLQREGLPLPAALGMFSPWVEAEQQLDTHATLVAVDPLLASFPILQDLALLYIGGNTALYSDPLVSPLRAKYASLFAGGKLPPTLIQVGLRELLLSDAVLLYHKMKQAAPAPGRVLISPYDAMWHVFQSAYQMPEAQEAHKEMADFFVRALSGKVCK